MIQLTTKLGPTDRPNRNKRIYSESCFKEVDRNKFYPVVFQGDDLALHNILCMAKIDYYNNLIEITTEPLINNNHRFPKFDEIIDAFNKGELKLTPYGHGLVEYNVEKDCYIVTNYTLTHFEICSQTAFDYYVTELKFL
ncbi:MAG: hypothetical protein J6R47_05710 [Acholeplasmatales bacterium]|nr:hypothetical protein [Acholeplasmatales bacterium]